VHTIVLATQKGGSGKSTLAIGLAVAAMQDGQRVRLLDADRQGTVWNWSRRRNDPALEVSRIEDASHVGAMLAALGHKGCTLAVIDTPGADGALCTTLAGAADLCLIPARPSPADLEAAAPTIQAVRKLSKPFALVLNQTPARSYRLSEAASALSATGVLALPYIVQRNDHQDALGAGLAVTEFAPHGKAAEEMRDLWRWVLNRLAPASFQHGTTHYETTQVRAAG
jgi:chromosome partitioning protein